MTVSTMMIRKATMSDDDAHDDYEEGNEDDDREKDHDEHQSHTKI